LNLVEKHSMKDFSTNEMQVEEILGYECMTPNCGAVSMELLNYCPLCGKKDWRAVVTRKRIEIKENPTADDILDDWGYIKEEYLPFESEVSIVKDDVSKRNFEIKYSSSSFQKDGTGAVTRVRMIDKINDRYVEKVIYTDTGTIIRDCDEKLTEHWGHGSAKDSKKK